MGHAVGMIAGIVAILFSENALPYQLSGIRNNSNSLSEPPARIEIDRTKQSNPRQGLFGLGHASALKNNPKLAELTPFDGIFVWSLRYLILFEALPFRENSFPGSESMFSRFIGAAGSSSFGEKYGSRLDKSRDSRTAPVYFDANNRIYR